MIGLKSVFLVCSFLILCVTSQRISEIKCKEYEYVTLKVNYIMSLPKQPSRKNIVDKCQHKSVGLVVGGIKAKAHEFPHQALLGNESNAVKVWFCGGSLVSSNFVLTAAHCLQVIEQRRTIPVQYAKLGMNTRSQSDRKTFIYEIEERFKHPDYTRKRMLNNDIALLKLKSNAKFTEFLYPICLPATQPDNMKAILTGFGQTGRHDSATQELMKVTLEKFSINECKKVFGEVDENTMICFGNRTDKGDACRGDSGGPLQVGNDNVAKCTYKILGVVSFGAQNCGTPEIPGVYMNVYYYLDWIEGIVWPDEARITISRGPIYPEQNRNIQGTRRPTTYPGRPDRDTFYFPS